MRFSLNDRPENIIAQFFSHLETRDKELARMLRTELPTSRELNGIERAQITRKAIQILLHRVENHD